MKKLISKIKNLGIRKMVFYSLVLAVFALALYNAKDLIFGIPLKISIASDGSKVYDTYLPINGISKHAKDIAINGRSIGIDREGVFTDGIILSPGYNVVEVAIKDQFGKEKVRQYRIVAEEKEDSVAQVEKESIKNNL